MPVKFYRRWISPLIAPRCRFYPTCSAYAQEACEQHGLAKGGLLAVWRVLRCNPWHGGKFEDPVPKHFDWKDLFVYKDRTHKG